VSGALRWLLKSLPVLLLVAWSLGVVWLSLKRLPPGLHIAGAWAPMPAQSARFLRDLSAADANGAPLIDQQINAELLGMIARAHQLVLLDTGLFGDLPAAGPGASRLRTALPIASGIVDTLSRAKAQHPDLAILLLTDPSTLQMDGAQHLLERLATAGVEVIAVDVAHLRPPDAAFTSFWDLCCRWWSRALTAAAWPTPLEVGPPEVSMQLWGELRNYQRSHRQLLLADDGAGGIEALLFSHPLHAEAGIESATALKLSGSALEPLIESEFTLAQFSGWSDGGEMQARAQRLLEQQRRRALIDHADSTRARVVTEAAIASTLVERIDAARKGDHIAIAALYLAQRELVRALIDAARRGVDVRLLLDPGKDGFGYHHSGIPNRQVASELISASDGAIRVRWYRTHGEQFSAGVVLILNADKCWLMVGTADLSRRDLGDFNLAAAAVVELPQAAAAAGSAVGWFDALWYNRASIGTEYTTDADVYADASQLSYWQYRLFEATGTSFD
jgi:hypothetical protein